MTFAAGARIGPYMIERAIGAGGMGCVYRAFDSRLERPVALKVLTAPEGDGEARRRLLAEARSASALNHPHICTVYEVGEHDASPFIAMEYVDGPDLHTRLLGGPLTVGEAIRLGWQVADALAHAHARNVIHRDLKTANVMVTAGDRVKVVDFGLAQRIVVADATTATETMAPAIAGTLASMAPEQIRGEPLDARCDVWAIGVLLHEMLTGSRPFQGATTFELSDRILHGDPAPLPDSTPARIAHIVRMCLARWRDSRFRDAREVRVAIEGLSDLLADPLLAMSVPRAPDGSPPQHDSAAAQFRLPPAVVVSSPERTTFAGRDAEWQRLEGCWQDSLSGRRQIVLVAGEPGIGKSRLALEFSRLVAAQGAAVLVGRCDEEALIAYQPFVEAFGHYVAVTPDSVLARDVASGATHLDALVPEIKRRVTGAIPPSDANAEGLRFRMFESVVALALALSQRQPLLLVLDDLHWADKATLLMLRHLARATHPMRLTVLGTYRDTEVARTHPLQELLADLRKEREVTRLALKGLGESDVGRVVAAWTEHQPAHVFVSRISQETEGNPFFLVEVLQHLSETGELARLEAGAAGSTIGLPEGVRETIGRRLSTLSPECGRMLSLAAVTGRDVSGRLLQVLGEAPDTVLLDALDEACRAGLLAEVPGVADRYSFTHALIRETLYDELSGTRRARAHLRVAEALERTSPSDGLPLADLAHHYLLGAPAGDPELAVTYAIEAGDQAAAQLANEKAAAFYQMAIDALELRPGPETRSRVAHLAARRGQAFAAVGQWAQAREAFESALESVDPEARDKRCSIVLDLAMAAFWQLDTDYMGRLAEEGIQLARQTGRKDLEARGLAWLARKRQAAGELAEAIELDRQALECEKGVRTVALCHAPLTLYLAGRSADAVDMGLHVVKAARELKDTGYIMYALPGLGLGLVGTGRYREGAQVFAEANEFGRKYGIHSLRARAMGMSAGFHLDLFAYDHAERLQQEARELARSADFAPPVISASVDLLFTYVRRHDVGRAEQIRDEVSDTIATAGSWHGWLWRLRFREAMAEIAAAREEWDDAIAEASACIEQSRVHGRAKYEALGLATRACAYHARGRTPAALDELEEAVRCARTTGDPALELRMLATRLAIEPTEATTRRAVALVADIEREIPDAAIAAAFAAAETVQLVRRLAPADSRP